MSSPAPLSEPSATAHVAVTLVHGTNARGATWTRLDSQLCQSMLQTFPGANIASFTWSGRNSALARQAAAVDFALWMRARHEQFPDALHYIVAHSHGGNVVLKGLSAAGSPIPIAGVACLSTPFLQARRRHLGEHGPSYLWGALGCLIVGVLLLVFGPSRDVDADSLRFAGSGDMLSFWYQALFVWALGLLMIPVTMWERRAPVAAEQFASACALHLSSDLNLLIVRSSGDEASGLLMAAQFVSWVAGVVWTRCASIGGDLIEAAFSRAYAAFRMSLAIINSTRFQVGFGVLLFLVLASRRSTGPQIVSSAGVNIWERGFYQSSLANQVVMFSLAGWVTIAQIVVIGPDGTGWPRSRHRRPDVPLLRSASWRGVVLFVAFPLVLTLAAILLGESGFTPVGESWLTQVGESGLTVVAFVCGLGTVCAVLYDLCRADFRLRTFVVWTVFALVSLIIAIERNSLEATLPVFVTLLVPGFVFIGVGTCVLLFQLLSVVVAVFCSAILWVATRIAYGADAAAASLYYDVTTDSTPAGSWTVNELDTVHDHRFLHSSHSDPRTFQILARWIGLGGRKV
jgi:hypothetical protein